MRTRLALYLARAIAAPLAVAGGVVSLAPAPAGAQTFSTLYSFTGGSDGAYPLGGLIQASDGNLYGTTTYSSASGASGLGGFGTVFRITTAGQLQTLYTFTGGDDGANPSGRLVQASDGNLYGTTAYGGASGQGTHGHGTVFRITLSGQLTTIYSFTGGSDGGYIASGLIQARDGYLYGAAEAGGDYGSTSGGYGTVFRISTLGALSAFSFTGGEQGANPVGSLVQDTNGYIYGTTDAGGGDYGNNADGIAFSCTTQGIIEQAGAFQGGVGEYPNGYLIQARDGSMYGTASEGGEYENNGIGFGTVYRLDPPYVPQAIYLFTGGADGSSPYGGVIQAIDGDLYGAAAYGGGGAWPLGYGTLFRMTTAGAFTLLHTFSGAADGAYPLAALTQTRDGAVYGETQQGGASGAGANRYGTIFRLVLGPPISDVTAQAGSSTAIVTWSTATQGTSVVQYGFTSAYGEQASTAGSTQAHSVTLSGLAPGTLYHYHVESSDASGNTSFTQDATFATSALHGPQLTLTYGDLRRLADGSVDIDVTITNSGDTTAEGGTIDTASMGGAASPTNPHMPFMPGFSLATGQSVTYTLTFPPSAGSSGQTVRFAASGHYMYVTNSPLIGSYGGSYRVTLP